MEDWPLYVAALLPYLALMGLVFGVSAQGDKTKKELCEIIFEVRKELTEANKKIEQLEAADKKIKQLEEQLAFYENWIEQQEKQLDQKNAKS